MNRKISELSRSSAEVGMSAARMVDEITPSMRQMLLTKAVRIGHQWVQKFILPMTGYLLIMELESLSFKR